MQEGVAEQPDRCVGATNTSLYGWGSIGDNFGGIQDADH